MSTLAEHPARHTALRIPANDLKEIDRRARAHNLSRTAFLINAALERLPDQRATLEERLEQLETRLDRAEQALFSTS